MTSRQCRTITRTNAFSSERTSSPEIHPDPRSVRYREVRRGGRQPTSPLIARDREPGSARRDPGQWPLATTKAESLQSPDFSLDHDAGPRTAEASPSCHQLDFRRHRHSEVFAFLAASRFLEPVERLEIRCTDGATEAALAEYFGPRGTPGLAPGVHREPLGRRLVSPPLDTPVVVPRCAGPKLHSGRTAPAVTGQERATDQ